MTQSFGDTPDHGRMFVLVDVAARTVVDRSSDSHELVRLQEKAQELDGKDVSGWQIMNEYTWETWVAAL
jgi:hypothetical protein